MFIGVSPAAPQAAGHIAALQARRAYADAMPFLSLVGVGKRQAASVDSYVREDIASDGETIAAAWNTDGVSISLYKPVGFSEDRPVYRARTWVEGSTRAQTRTIDASRVDPRNADELEMLIMTTFMSERKEPEGAARTFIKVRDEARAAGESTEGRMNWLDKISEAMIAKYGAGDMDGFVELKELWDKVSDMIAA